jgi:hypothetical protein
MQLGPTMRKACGREAFFSALTKAGGDDNCGLCAPRAEFLNDVGHALCRRCDDRKLGGGFQG